MTTTSTSTVALTDADNITVILGVLGTIHLFISFTVFICIRKQYAHLKNRRIRGTLLSFTGFALQNLSMFLSVYSTDCIYSIVAFLLAVPCVSASIPAKLFKFYTRYLFVSIAADTKLAEETTNESVDTQQTLSSLGTSMVTPYNGSGSSPVPSANQASMIGNVQELLKKR